MTKTNRPELVAETQLAVRMATNAIHLLDFFMRDATEQLFTLPALNYNAQFDITALTRFRKLRYIKKFDLASQVTREGEDHQMMEADPAHLFDRYNIVKTNLFYLAGTNLNVKSSTNEQAWLLSWYMYPNTDPETYKSWVADVYPAIIIDRAVADIFRDIGMTDDANKLERKVDEFHFPLLRQQDILVMA